MDEEMKKVELSTALMLSLFILLLGVAFLLNVIINNNISISEFNLRIKSSEPISNSVFIKESNVSRSVKYIWESDNEIYEHTFNISNDNFLFFKSLERSFSEDYSYYVNIDYRDDFLDDFILKIDELAISRRKKLDNVMDLVQSIKGENESDNYPKFPVETLYDAKGDCEDTAILGSRILNSLGFETVFIEFDKHIGLGINIEGEGTFFYFNGKKFFYYEPTGSNFQLGELPDYLKNKKASIYASAPDSLIEPSFIFKKIETKYSEPYYNVSLNLSNMGKRAEFIVIGIIESRKSPEFSKKVKRVLVEENSSKKINMDLIFPYNEEHRMKFTINSHLSNPIYRKTSWIPSSN